MKKNLLLKLSTLLTLAGLFCMSVSFGQATLKHSYTFDEGTYDETTVFDQVGSVDGTLGGANISIADGKATVSGATVNSDGWISLDGVALALNTYSAVSLEAFVETGEVLNASYTMLAYFGSSTPGSNCLWIQPTRSGNETRIEANNGSTTVTAFVSGYEVDDGKMHHIVAVLNSEALTYYLDGLVIAQIATGADYVSTLGTDVANLFRGVDGWNDPNYNASLLEFNIYDGTLDQFTIAQTAGEFLGLDLTNAELENLTTSVGTMDPAFDPETEIYEITVPYGTTSLTLNAEPVVGGVAVKMFDGLGTQLNNGVVTFDKDEGIDVEIIVTALDAITEHSFFVAIFPEDGETSATLSNIELSVGGLIEDFMMDSTSYTALVPTGTTSVDVTGIPNWDNATVTGGGTIALTDGMGSVTLIVTSEDGTATMEYTVDIATSNVETGTDFYLVHEANGFVATESGESFNQVVLAEAVVDSSAQIWQFEDSGVEDQFYIMNKDGNYICLSRTSANAWDIEVYPDLPETDLDSARFILNEFEPGRFRIISVKRQQASATANVLSTNVPYLGSAVFSNKAVGDRWDDAGYTIWNLKYADDKTIASPVDVHLADLSIAGNTLKPVFNPAYRDYYVTIPEGVTSVDITATPRDAAAMVTGAGVVDVSDGMGTITLTVVGSDPTYTRDYMIHYTMLNLKHQFTFEEGTYDATKVEDQVGSVDGMLGGSHITIADGKATVSGATGNSDGWISMDGEALALKNYNAITVEVMLHAGNMENTGYTMLTYFGTSEPGNGCFWIQPARSGDESRMETNDLSNTITASLPGYEIDDSLKHHVVGVLDRSSLKYYLDGELVSENSMAGMDFIRGLGTDVANIFRGVDGWNDPNYNASLYEYNIWDGTMSEDSILERANRFLGGLGRDATLSSITVDAGTLLPAFNPDVMSYSVVIPSGTTTINITAVPTDENATIEGAGAIDVSSGAVSDTIVVTAEDGFRTRTYVVGFEAPGEYTLMHSYTFDDGTAADVVGGADGMLGSGVIADGGYTSASDSDYVELPAETIAINTYSEITLEAFIYSDVDNTGSNMLAYFGGNENAVGGNGYFFTPDRNAESRTAISCGNVTEPWNAEQGVTGPPVSAGEMHHVVSVLTGTSIKLYIDGVLEGEAVVSGDNSIANLSNANAWLGKGGYTADPSWMGTIDEFNIYEGVMDAATVAERAKQYLEAGSLTLMHSYTFEDGTANDMVGTAHGTLEGDAAVADGMLNLTGNGFVTLPAMDINIPSYSSISIEGVFMQAEGLDGFTAFASFGNTDTVAALGNNYIILQPTRDDGDNSRTSISCLNTATPWSTENGVMGDEIKDTETHHWVTVVTESEIKLYIDGMLIGTDSLTGDNSLANIGTNVALIGKDVYPNDPLWQGSMEELNIWQGEMDAATVATRYSDFTTGISVGNFDEASILVYPTYSSGHFTIETAGGRGMITVYNLLGKLVTQKAIENSRETVTVNERGMYLMRIESEGITKTFKVFKTR